jgi:hypothetical protein
MYYNLMDSLKRFSDLSDCKLFSVVLEEKLPVAIRDDHQAMLDMLHVRTMTCCISD